MYDYILDQEEKRFLVEDMFGTDWKGLGNNYRKFLPTSTTTMISPNLPASFSASLT